MQLLFLSILGVAVLVLVWRVIVLERRLRIFFQSKGDTTQEALLFEHGTDLALLKEKLGDIDTLARTTHKQSAAFIQKVGMVRFNPFASSGGDQSFAIALLDGTNSGVVISSLYVRGGLMVYAKPIEGGASPYTLSDEEKRALTMAQERA